MKLLDSIHECVMLSTMASRRRAAKPQNIVDDIAGAVVGYARSVTGATRSRPTDNRSTARARDLTRNVLGAGVQTGDALLSGGVASSFYRNVAQPIGRVGPASTREPNFGAFGRDAAIAAASAAAGAAAGSVVARGAQVVANARTSRNVVLLHGGPANLTGGVINPSVVGPRTVRANNTVIAQNRQSINKFPERMANIANYAKQTVRSKAPVSQKASRLKDLATAASKEVKANTSLKRWTVGAEKNNYFTAVDRAEDAYIGSGASSKIPGFDSPDRAVHVIKVPRKNVLKTPATGEYGVNRPVKPVTSIPSGTGFAENQQAMITAQKTLNQLTKPVTVNKGKIVGASVRGAAAATGAKNTSKKSNKKGSGSTSRR